MTAADFTLLLGSVAPPPLRAQLAAHPHLGAMLVARYAKAQAAYAPAAVGPEPWLRRVARGLEGRSAEELEALHLEDLYLAVGCGAADKAALRHFERLFDKVLRERLGRMGEAERRDEVRSLLSPQLLLGEGARAPALDGYTGRSSLSTWLKVIAVREVLRLRRAAGRQVRVGDAPIAALVAHDVEPELRELRNRHQRDFAKAFEEAIAALDERGRAVLRYHAVDHLNIEQIGGLYRVHKTTAFRWLEKAKREVMEGTRTRFRAKLGLAEKEVNSLMRVFMSGFEVTLSRVLAQKD